MPLIEKINFGFFRTLPMILQTEASECGLACIAMISSFHGCKVDLITLRKQFSISLKGSSLSGIMRIAENLGLGCRPLRAELDELEQLQTPCILHWNFNHFVILKKVGSKGIKILDPARGSRVLSREEVSKGFTGVALEIWPVEGFKRKDIKQAVELRSLTGRVKGALSAFIQIIVLALILEIFTLISPFFLQWVIDNVIVSADRDLLATLSIGFGLLMIMQQLVSAIRSWVILYFSTTLNIQWKSNVFAHLIRLPVQYFEKRHLGDVISRFSATEVIQRTLTTSFIEGILDGLMAIVSVIIMFIYSPTLSYIAVAAILAYVVVRIAWYRPLRCASEEQIVHSARQEGHLLETMRGIKTIKLFTRQEERRSSWLALLIEQINAQVRTAKLQIFYRLINGVLFGLENVVIVWLGARLVIEGNFSVGVLTAFISYKNQFADRVSSLVDKVFEIKMLQLQGERLADIVLTEPEALGKNDYKFGSETIALSIAVRGIRFRYGEQEPYILDGVSFDIPAGASVAIIGSSGCGKTTLLNLLLGVLSLVEGEITVGETPLEKIGVDQFRSIVGTVLQDDVLFAGSIAENISFFDSEFDYEWMVRCAEIAAIGDDISKMPMSYNTLIGDMGTVLSGGQKQRVLLARALYKRPRILFLDEATSNLDVKNEKEVNEAISNLKITRIIIAHRPETIASVERVIVLGSGKVVYDGVPLANFSSQDEKEVVLTST